MLGKALEGAAFVRQRSANVSNDRYLLIRLLLLELKIRRIGRRVGERGLAWAYILHDFWAPVGEFALALGNRIRPNRKIWR